MSLYFLNELRSRSGGNNHLNEMFDAPIKIEQGTWEHLDEPRRLSKIFVFDDAAQQRFFVSELMQSVDIRHHDIKIMIESDVVQVETRTETIDDITELDLQIARTADSIYDDAQFVLEVE